MSDCVIKTENLTRRFRAFTAVDNLNLTIHRGEIYAFLGRNGAGKSTTIRMLLGMISCSSGNVQVLGSEVKADSSIWQRVGHLVESPTSYPELTVLENLEVVHLLHNLRDRNKIDMVIDQLHLGRYTSRKAHTLSSGNLQRLCLARALLPDPDLLILDEPASALDPSGVVEVRELLKNLAKEKGTTIFMSSHILGEVDRLATRIGIIHHGRLIEEISAGDLEVRRRPELHLSTSDINKTLEFLTKKVFSAKYSDDSRILSIPEKKAVENPELIAEMLVRAGLPPKHLSVEQENLENHFLRITQEAE